MSTQLRARYLFGKSPLPQEIDLFTANVIKRLEKIETKSDYLKLAYDEVTTYFEASRIKTLFRVWELFSNNIEDLTNRSGFLHCTNQNYILTNILVKSGKFTESDIQIKWTLIWYWSPHQYLKIRLESESINVDCWGRTYGISLGNYASGFNSSFSKSFAK